ncbi:MAG: O-antigen ligase family protein [Patescibacteria group bacterium]
MNSIVKKILKALIYALPAVSLVVADGMYFPFITGKSFLFRIAVELCLFLYIGLAFVDKSYRPKWSNILKAFIYFVVVIFIADIFAINQTKAFFSNFERMEGFVLIAHLFAYFVILANVLRDKRDWDRMLYSTTAISIFMTFFAFLQFFGGAVINQSNTRLDGTLGNSAYLATYLVFHIFFLLYLWISNGNKLKGIADSVIYGSSIYILYYLMRIATADDSFNYTKAGGIIFAIALLTIVKMCWLRFSKVFAKYERIHAFGLYVFLILAELVALYYTSTRGGLLGFIGGAIGASIIVIIFEKENKFIKKAAIAILATLFIIVAGFFVVKNTNFVQTDPVLNRFASISFHDTTQARAMIWPMAIKAWEEHPVLGWGQDNFIFAFTKYYVPEMISQEPWFDRAHNAFLDWLVAGGLLGLLGWLLLYVFSFVSIVRSKNFNVPEKAVLLGLFGAFAFQSLFIFDNLTSYMLFVLILALASFGERNLVEETKSKKEELSGATLAMLIGIFLIVMFLINYSAYKQNITLSKSLSSQPGGYTKNLELIEAAINAGPTGRFESLEQMDNIARSVISADGIPDKDKGDFALHTFNAFGAYNKDNPDDIRGVLTLGTFLTDIGLYADGIPLLEQARTMSPKKQQIYYSLAKAYLIKFNREKNKDDQDKAVAYLKQAYEFDPQMAEPRSLYLNTLVAIDRLSEASALLATIPDPKINLDKNTVDMLVGKGLLK